LLCSSVVLWKQRKPRDDKLNIYIHIILFILVS
jgi:hypothetical protein